MRYETDTRVKVEVLLPPEQFEDVEIISLKEEVKESRDDQIWNVGVGGSISIKPIIHEGIVYFGSCDKNFYALDKETGKKVTEIPAGPFYLTHNKAPTMKASKLKNIPILINLLTVL